MQDGEPPLEVRMAKMTASMPKILLICDPASARGMFALKRLVDIGLNPEVIPAVFPPATHPWSPRYDELRRVAAYGYPMIRGEIGCFLAHRDAWRRVTEGPDDLVLVLEDDAVLAVCDLDAISTVAARRELDDMVTLLFTVSHPSFRCWRQVGAVSIVRPTGTTHSTVAYLVGIEGAARLLAHSETFFCPVDDYLNMSYLHGVTLMLTYPFLAGYCSNSPSLIGLRTKPKLTNLQRLKRNGFRLLRRLRAGLHGLSVLFKMGILFSRTERRGDLRSEGGQ